MLHLKAQLLQPRLLDLIHPLPILRLPNKQGMYLFRRSSPVRLRYIVVLIQILDWRSTPKPDHRPQRGVDCTYNFPQQQHVLAPDQKNPSWNIRVQIPHEDPLNRLLQHQIR